MIQQRLRTFVSLHAYGLAIVLLAAILRLLNLGTVDFVHDELSALSRVGFPGFMSLIREGVMTDMHPPLVQVFMHYWTALTGFAEWSVKLPFILAGIASVWLTYRIGRSWFSVNAGLCAAAFLACTEYVLVYHQQARPYAAGMFFCLVAAWGFSRYYLEESGRAVHRWTFILLSAAACYTHHLALMQVGLFCIGGLLLLPARQRRSYFVSLLLTGLLYLPNLPVLIVQLGYKGVGGWLGRPSADSFIYTGKWMTHYSFFAGIVVIILTGISFFFFNRKQFSRRLFCLLLGACCLAIPYYYSLAVNPIFQFSSFFIILPFLLLGIFGGIPDRPAWMRIIPLILIVSQLSTFFKRDYYDIAAHQPIAEMCRQTMRFLDEHPGQNTLCLLNTEEWFVRFYQRRHEHPFPFKTYWHEEEEVNNRRLRDTLSTLRPRFVISAWMPPVTLPLLNELMPCIVEHRQSPQLDFYVLGKEKEGRRECEKEKVLFRSCLSNEKDTAHWVRTPHRETADSTGGIVLSFPEGEEFGSSFEAPLSITGANRYSVIGLSAEIRTGDINERKAELVCVLTRHNKLLTVIWRSQDISTQLDAADTTRWQKVYMRLPLIDFFRENERMENLLLQVYVWNIEKVPMEVRNFTVEMLEGNPQQYSLYEE